MHDDLESSAEATTEDYEEIGVFEGRPAAQRSSVFSVRFRPDQLAAIEIASEMRGVSIGEFIRQAALREATGEDPATLGLRRLMAEVERAGGHLAIVSNTGDIRDLDRPA